MATAADTAVHALLSSYVVGAKCWFPHQKDAFISGHVTAKRIDGDSVALDFLDEQDRVRPIPSPIR